MISDLLSRLRAVFLRRCIEKELDDELRFHFEREVEKLRQPGLRPRLGTHARARSRRRLYCLHARQYAVLSRAPGGASGSACRRSGHSPAWEAARLGRLSGLRAFSRSEQNSARSRGALLYRASVRDGQQSVEGNQWRRCIREFLPFTRSETRSRPFLRSGG